MEPFEFVKLIKRPRYLNQNTLIELSGKIEMYPYCAVLRMLYLKNLNIVNPAVFKDAVNKTAIFLPDRRKLFEIIHETDSENSKIETSPVVYSIESAFETPTEEDNLNTNFFGTFKSKDADFTAISEGGNSCNSDEHLDSDEDDTINIHENPDFITEALAQVYIKKGNFEHAIKTYEKLCLKYPEKSTYFAAQIENLNKKL